MKKKHGNYLVVGAGAVASSVILALSRKGVDFSLSIENKKHLQKANLFDVPTHLYFSGLGGLANYWHSVIDSHWFNFLDTDTDEFLLNIFNINVIPKVNSEIIPFTPFRPKSFLSSFVPNQIFGSVESILPANNCVMVTFDSGETYSFKKVFICTGAVSSEDILVKSGLARYSETLSDHVIGYSDNLVHEVKDNYIISDRFKWGFSREYDLSDKFKTTYRPIFSKSLYQLKDKATYSGSAVEILIKLAKQGTFSILQEALSLRYGLNIGSPLAYRKFYQLNVPNCYRRHKSEFQADFKAVKAVINSTGESIKDSSLLSGIHFYNSLSSLDSDVIVRNSECNGHIFLFTSSYDFNPGPHHFTYFLMKNAYISVMDMIND